MNLIVFYSRSGNMRKVAESYARIYGGDLCEIHCEVDYSGPLGFAEAGAAALAGQAPPIAPIAADLSRYERVVVCGAIWAGRIASPARTFLQEYGPRCSEVEYIIARRDPKNSYENVFDEMDALCGKQRVKATSLVHGEALR